MKADDVIQIIRKGKMELLKKQSAESVNSIQIKWRKPV
jgi:hypothetical protein